MELTGAGPAGAWAVLRQHLIWVLGCGVVGAAVGAGGSYLMKPVYRAEVVTVASPDQQNPINALAGQLGVLAELGGLNLGGGGSGGKGVAVATLKSRALTDEFLRDRELLPVLFSSQWDEAQKRWKTDDPPSAWEAYRFFDTSIRKVTEDRKTNLVSLAIEWHDPKAAAEWANELIGRANRRLQQDRIAEGKKTISYLEDELARARAVEVRQALYSLIERETKSIAVAHAREQFAFKVIDPAVPPTRRVRPNRWALLLLGLVGGVSLAALAIIVRNPQSQ